MHELSIAQSLIDLASEAQGRAVGERILSVRVRLGVLSCVAAEALRFCFDVVSQGTDLEGADLEIEVAPMEIACSPCGFQGVGLADNACCPRCSSRDVKICKGRELELVSMEVG